MWSLRKKTKDLYFLNIENRLIEIFWSFCHNNKPKWGKSFGFANILAKSLGGNGIVDWRKKYTVMQSAGFRMESGRQWTDWSTSSYGWPYSSPRPATPLFLKWKGPLWPTAVCSLAIRSGEQWLQRMLISWENLKASPVWESSRKSSLFFKKQLSSFKQCFYTSF